MPNTFQGFPTVPRLPWDDLYINTIFESLDGFPYVFSGSGVPSISGGALKLTTGITISSFVSLYKQVSYAFPRLTWAKRREFRTTVNLISNTNSSSLFWIITGDQNIKNGFGFKFENGKLYAHTGNGTAETNTLIQDFGAGAIDITFRFACIFTPGVSVLFYVDDVLSAIVTTTLPSGTLYSEFIFDLLADNVGLALERILYCSLFSIWQEY